MKICLTSEQLKLTQNILVAHLDGIEVWAFGSRVSFTNRKNSDLDLVIVGPQRQSLKTIAHLTLAFEESTLPFTVDVLDYCTLSERMKEQVLQNHVVLLTPQGPLAPPC